MGDQLELLEKDRSNKTIFYFRDIEQQLKNSWLTAERQYIHAERLYIHMTLWTRFIHKQKLHQVQKNSVIKAQR